MDGIPNELLIHIVDQLRGPTTWSEPADYSRMHALAALCCVSKKLYHIAKPLLYESIDLPSNAIIYPQSQRLWMRLQEHPRLRLDVKTLRQKTRPNLKHEQLRRIHVRHEYEQDIIRHLRSAGLGAEDAHSLLVRFLAREDLFFALVAFQTPNLEHLWLRPRPFSHGLDEGCTLLEGLGRMAMGVRWLNTHHFEHLKTLYLDLVSTPEMSPQYALPLLLLPNLDELTIGSWGGDPAYEGVAFDWDDKVNEVFDRPWVWPVRSSPITKLSLLRPYVSENKVKMMVLACKALQRFECVHPICRPLHLDQWFGDLLPTLSNHVESLEDFSFVCKMHGPSLAKTGMAQLDRLHQFTNLTSARVSLYVVSDPGRQTWEFLPSFFPPSLECLHIHYPRKPDPKTDWLLLDILTGCKEGHLPSLRDVCITWVYFQPEEEEYDFLERLRSLLDVKQQYGMSSIKFDILFTIRDDKFIRINWPELVNLEGLVMNGTHMSDEYQIDGVNETTVFVDFTTCPGRYTVEELQDHRDHGYFS